MAETILITAVGSIVAGIVLVLLHPSLLAVRRFPKRAWERWFRARPQTKPEPAAPEPLPKRRPKLPPKPSPNYTDYTSDRIDGANWRWAWRDGRITDLWAACPMCDSELVPYQDYFASGVLLCCERCHPSLDLPVNEPGGPYSSFGLEDNPMKVVGRIRGIDTVKREIRHRLGGRDD